VYISYLPNFTKEELELIFVWLCFSYLYITDIIKLGLSPG